MRCRLSYLPKCWNLTSVSTTTLSTNLSIYKAVKYSTSDPVALKPREIYPVIFYPIMSGLTRVKSYILLHDSWDLSISILCYFMEIKSVRDARKYICTAKTRTTIISIPHGYPDSKIQGANMGPIWGRQDPGGPHVGPMNLVFWVWLLDTPEREKAHSITWLFNEGGHGGPCMLKHLSLTLNPVWFLTDKRYICFDNSASM